MMNFRTHIRSAAISALKKYGPPLLGRLCPPFRTSWAEYRRLKENERLRLSPAASVSEEAPLEFTPWPEVAGPAEAWLPPRWLFPPSFVPLRAEAAERPAKINVALPSISARHTSGGPNTAYALAAELVKRNLPVRLMSVNIAADKDGGPIRRHIARLGGLTAEQAGRLELLDASQRDQPACLGRNDIFIATAWWTAQMVKYILPRFAAREFIYLIQDFEPLIHNASSNYALALETYDLPMLPIFNSRLLRDYFLTEKVGPFADPGFAEASLCFEPALDRTLFYPAATEARGARKRLLFYARPEASRNLWEMGLGALMKVLAEGCFDGEPWDFFSTDTGIGRRLPPVVLRAAPEVIMRPLPLFDLAAWAEELRRTDVMLSLILSPHTSYPPLEAAACGARVVTNTWSVKTGRRLQEISPRLISGPPSLDGLAQALTRALKPGGLTPPPSPSLSLPQTWAESFAPVMPGLLDFLAQRGLKAKP